MPLVPIDSLADPRLDPYRNLKDHELAKLGNLFIAEGRHVVERLLESDYPVESVMAAEHSVGQIAARVPATVPLYVVPDEMVKGIIGFQFHSGLLACGRRKPRPRLEDVLPVPRAPQVSVSPGPGRPGSQVTLVICPEIINAENVGMLIRISAGFGADAMLLGERSCDPFWRRAIRVSMGTVFRLPLIHSDDLLTDLKRLREEWRVELIGTVLDADAQPLDTAVRPTNPDRIGLLFGSESQGLHRRWLGVCDRKVTIPMKHGTDSLNVAIAAAVFLYHFS